MNLLYVCTSDIGVSSSLGIIKKIRAQILAFQNADYSVYFFYLKSNSVFVEHDDKKEFIEKVHFPVRDEVLRSIVRYLKRKELKIDWNYCRYPLADAAFIKLLKYVTEQGGKNIIEVPTYPYDQELSGSLTGDIVLLFDKTYQKKISKYVNIIASFGWNEPIFGIQTICIVNGVDVSTITPRKVIDHGDCINLLAVAGIRKLHGYDRVILGIYDYYKNGGSRQIHFHIVGDGDGLPDLRKLVNQYHLEQYVSIYGALQGKELDEIYDKADIVAEGFGTYHKGIAISSSLKSRECIAKGLPIISQGIIDVLTDRDSEFALHVKDNTSEVDILNIIEWYDRLRMQYQISELNERIHKIAVERCDINVTMKPIIQYMRDN